MLPTLKHSCKHSSKTGLSGGPAASGLSAAAAAAGRISFTGSGQGWLAGPATLAATAPHHTQENGTQTIPGLGMLGWRILPGN